MSLDKRKLLLPLLIVFTHLFISGCLPFQEDNSETAEIGRPNIECGSDGKLIIVFPASRYYIDALTYRGANFNPEDPASFNLLISLPTGVDVENYQGGQYGLNRYTPSTIVFSVPGPPVDTSTDLYLTSNMTYFTSMSFQVILPACSPDEISTESESKPELIAGGITNSCDGEDLVVSFEFDQPVSGELTFSWYDDEDSGGDITKTASMTAQDDTVVSFRLENAYALAGAYNIQPSSLRFLESGESVNLPNETFHWDSCILADELLAPDRMLSIINAMCVGKGVSKQLMLVFEFEQDVMGQYEVFVDDVQYEQAPVVHPKRLFFFGTAPPGGGMPHILMQTQSDQIAVFEVTDFEVPQCDFERQDDGGDDGYIPPPYNPPGE